MARREPRELTVVGSERITPNMHRVTLGGPGMRDFPAHAEGGYVKLHVPPPGGPGSNEPTRRTYSIRAQRENEIDLDFVLHGDGGPASRWAVGCTAGETILVGGPGPRAPVDPAMDWFLLAGDMTALPAISVNIEHLPADATGYVAIEVIDAADIQDLPLPAGMEIEWLGEEPGLLADHVRRLPWRDGNPSAWAASEFSAMRALRDYLRVERGLGKANLYISSYWKHGSGEDAHRIAKREDAQAAAL